jgi:hypothetical protein
MEILLYGNRLCLLLTSLGRRQHNKPSLPDKEAEVPKDEINDLVNATQ